MAAVLSAIEAALRRDRLIVAVCLAVITLLCWVYLVDMALDAGGIASLGNLTGMAPMPAPSWDTGYVLSMFVMWVVMMTGMMVPSAAPMILIYARIQRKQGGQAPYVSAALFTAGYLLTWAGFSVLAVAGQWGLWELGLLDRVLVGTSYGFAGALFLVAGVYQVTPVKQACLRHCQSPLHFLSRHWRKGRYGAMRMGAAHGAYCLGCCWAIMGLLFTLGLMNIIWVAVLAIYVLLEKVVPAQRGRLVPRLGAAAMILTGLFFIARGAGVA